jgi:predicted aspartyl protease
LFNRAVVLTQEGQEENSARILRTLLRSTGATLEKNVRTLLMLNERSLFHYQEALQAIFPLLQHGGDQNLSNKARLLEALADVPPETIEHGPVLDLLSFHPVAVVGHSRLRSLIDTGASFSAISRSAARRAGLRIRVIRYQIETVLGRTIEADVAVADVTLAPVRIHNAVFLVLPDAAFGKNGTLSAIIGIPILRQLAVTLGKERPRHGKTAEPMKFLNGTPVVNATVEGVRMQCEIDTGADRSSFSVPYLPAFAFDSASAVAKDVSVVSATGKARLLHGYMLPTRIDLAGRTILLTRAFAASERPFRRMACSLGRDTVLALAPVNFDFRSMRLILR